jgi:hypothetical protein
VSQSNLRGAFQARSELGQAVQHPPQLHPDFFLRGQSDAACDEGQARVGGEREDEERLGSVRRVGVWGLGDGGWEGQA